jgi:type III secretory pathway component EscV
MNLTTASVLVFIAALATLALAALFPGPTFIFIAMVLIGVLVMLQTYRILVDNDEYQPLDEG